MMFSVDVYEAAWSDERDTHSNNRGFGKFSLIHLVPV